MYAYRLVLDTGIRETITANSRGEAIETYCRIHGVSREWMDEHCKAINCGRVSYEQKP